MVLALIIAFLMLSTDISHAANRDTAFSSDGRVDFDLGSTVEEKFTDVAVQADGKIVVVGCRSESGSAYSVLTARYTSTGELDPSFSADGMILTTLGTLSCATSVDVLADGSIMVTASHWPSDFAFLKFDSTGAPDTTFNGTGQLVTQVDPLGPHDPESATTSDGNIYAAGEDSSAPYSVFVAAISASGALVPGFGTSGVSTIPTSCNSADVVGVALQSDAKIVVAYECTGGGGTSAAYVARLTTAGVLDTTFSADGIANYSPVEDARPSGLEIQSSGRIVVGGIYDDAGNSGSGAVAFTPAGDLDTSFGNGGIITAVSHAGASLPGFSMTPSGEIYLFGVTGYMARLTVDGVLDTTFSGGGFFSFVDDPSSEGSPTPYASAVQTDGKVLVVGQMYTGGLFDGFVFRVDPSSSMPTNTEVPAIGGTATPGGTLSCTLASWSGSITSYTIEWLVGGSVVAGPWDVTGTTTYALQNSVAVGASVACRITAVSSEGSVAATSSAVSVGASSTTGTSSTTGATTSAADVCENLAGTQESVPTGLVLLAGNCIGSSGNDTIVGTNGADAINGGAGNDRISGGSGNDKLSGGTGNDIVNGDAGNDRITGGGGNDALVGGSGNDFFDARDSARNAGRFSRLAQRAKAKDSVNCGKGKDRVKADRNDKVAKNCEIVNGRGRRFFR